MLNVCTHQLKEKEKEYTKENICIKWTINYFLKFDVLENPKKAKALSHIHLDMHTCTDR